MGLGLWVNSPSLAFWGDVVGIIICLLQFCNSLGPCPLYTLLVQVFASTCDENCPAAPWGYILRDDVIDIKP